MFESFKKVLVEDLRVNPDDITLEAELASDLGINSLELADLAFYDTAERESERPVFVFKMSYIEAAL